MWNDLLVIQPLDKKHLLRSVIATNERFPPRPGEGLLACGARVELQECFLTSLWRGIKCVMREIGAVT